MVCCAVRQKPDKDEWGCGLDAMRVALSLERSVNESLLELHKVATRHCDCQASPAAPMMGVVFTTV